MNLMRNDIDLRDRYLNQYKDIYGENIYLSSIGLDKKKNNRIKGGSELTAFYHLIKDCKDCTYFDATVNLGNGDENSTILFIPESKHQMNDDHNKNSLIGEAGELFDKILAAIKINRKNIYISNMFKYTISKNSDSYQSDIKICKYHFQQHLQLINPSLVVALGENVGNKMLDKNESIEYWSGRIHKFNNYDLMVTHHPEAVLKNPNLKKSIWEDFKKIRDNYLN